jgi:hypothetical protein
MTLQRILSWWRNEQESLAEQERMANPEMRLSLIPAVDSIRIEELLIAEDRAAGLHRAVAPERIRARYLQITNSGPRLAVPPDTYTRIENELRAEDTANGGNAHVTHSRVVQRYNEEQAHVTTWNIIISNGSNVSNASL